MVLRPSSRTALRCARGYTLVETLIALTIFTTAILAVSGSMMMVLSSGMQTTENARATALAVQKLEELKALPAASIVSESIHLVAADGSVGAGPYSRWVTVADTAGGPNTAGITVYVRYANGMLGNRTVRIQTLIYTGP
jgi:prepilin-type N-terminal cleavage/methylation domain-containing protein